MDTTNQRIAILGLVFLGLTAVAGCVLLAARGITAPEPLIALGGVCVGSLGTFACLRNGNGNGNGRYPPLPLIPSPATNGVPQ